MRTEPAGMPSAPDVGSLPPDAADVGSLPPDVGSLPLPPGAADVYQDLLRVAPVAQREFLSTVAPQAGPALAGLVSIGAVHRDAAGVLHVRPPRSALESWAAQREMEAARARAAAEALSGLYTAVHGTGAAFVEVIEGKHAVRELFRQLQAGARTEVRGLERGPYLRDTARVPEEVQYDALRRGLRYRCVYEGELLHDEAMLAAVRDAVAAGEQARVFPELPLKMMLTDADSGLVVLPRGDDADAMLVHRSRLLDGLSELFEVFWRLGAPIHATTDAAQPDAEPTAATQRLLALLTAGLTDEAIARDLGVSNRTVHRRVSRLQELLGARSRFQLGVQASRRGWL
ncbi:LuxR C-terminal-related transcriptional regulator [Micromonospora profundi]|uniref:LuxR C-terminal-related transcriptional regulator n=1 Tax=Micromonospora profundi TaxID=1420889 RepID=A0AAJ6L220_9ACTN|nr:LuxR C-terminal-related transcriptional regulator [Micromonospora profundi]WLS44486.1 LuxR C-terminal-related transcriptional regulator [Micromonospora profundi]